MARTISQIDRMKEILLKSNTDYNPNTFRPKPKEKKGFAGYATFEEMLRENYEKSGKSSTSGNAKKPNITTNTTTEKIEVKPKVKVNHNIEELNPTKDKHSDDGGFIGRFLKKILN